MNRYCKIGMGKGGCFYVSVCVGWGVGVVGVGCIWLNIGAHLFLVRILRCTSGKKTILDLYSLSSETSRNHEIGCHNDSIALKFHRHVGSGTAELPVKFQSDWNSLNFTKSCGKMSHCFVNRSPVWKKNPMFNQRNANICCILKLSTTLWI